jgi:hypothetical protein
MQIEQSTFPRLTLSDGARHREKPVQPWKAARKLFSRRVGLSPGFQERITQLPWSLRRPRNKIHPTANSMPCASGDRPARPSQTLISAPEKQA